MVAKHKVALCFWLAPAGSGWFRLVQANQPVLAWPLNQTGSPEPGSGWFRLVLAGSGWKVNVFECFLAGSGWKVNVFECFWLVLAGK